MQAVAQVVSFNREHGVSAVSAVVAQVAPAG
jgi:hypothetical protein